VINTKCVFLTGGVNKGTADQTSSCQHPLSSSSSGLDIFKRGTHVFESK